MTSPPRKITVQCPRCSTEFQAWHRASINLDLDPWAADELEELTTATCPTCSTRIALDTLVVADGVWTVGG